MNPKILGVRSRENNASARKRCTGASRVTFKWFFPEEFSGRYRLPTLSLCLSASHDYFIPESDVNEISSRCAAPSLYNLREFSYAGEWNCEIQFIRTQLIRP